MYEMTAEELHKKILAAIDDTYQKTIGYPTYDITKAFAYTLQSLYKFLSETADKLDVDQLSGEELDRFVKQRKGILRKEATFASCVLTVYGTGTVNEGDLFESAGGVQFMATKTVSIIETGQVPVTAVIAGAAGNVGTGAITMIPKTISGITGCNNTDPAVGGYEAESDDSLRKRYYSALRQPPTSGNIYHYMQWAREVSGVGDAKVFPLWAGDNTVQVVIIDDESQPADDALVAAVQEYIDPESSGTGDGEAPIGAYCTVTSALGKELTVSVALRLFSEYDLAAVKENIAANITAYLKSIAFAQNYVSYGKIANAINDSVGVEDYSDLLVNDGTANIFVEEKEVAVLSEVIVIEQERRSAAGSA